MTTGPRVLYVVICGVSNAATSYDFIDHVAADGWDVCALTTPMGARFVDADQLARSTGHPVRSTYKNPDDPDELPPADVCVVAPASFNTVNKIANGISDTLAVGVVCEAIGKRQPVIIVPWMNRALAAHSAYARSIHHLQDDGVKVLLTDRTTPGGLSADPDGSFPWNELVAEVRTLRNDIPAVPRTLR